MSTPPRPGVVVLHGDRLEDLLSAVRQWLAANPLPPLVEDTFLVQSNAVGEWLQWQLAEGDGICAGIRVALPARFLWESYRRVLGPQGLLDDTAWSKAALRWRLLRLLRKLEQETAASGGPPMRFATLAESSTLERRWRLAGLLADLLDQYQVYRADWLQDWAAGRWTLRDGRGALQDLPVDQQWQAQLWQWLCQEMAGEGRPFAGRGEIHQAFLRRLHEADPASLDLPPRLIFFGAVSLPAQTLEALAALGRHLQVLMAIPNPSPYHWSEVTGADEDLRRQRHGQPGAVTAAGFGPALLAAWGRQGRDFMRLLDRFDESTELGPLWGLQRVDFFSEDTGRTLLRQLQTRIRDLTDRRDPPQALAESDDSLVFHSSYGPLRELQVLQDELLLRLRADTGLRPRDIVVMVPDIATYAPLIPAVFGAYGREDPRHIPFHVVDLSPQERSPLVRTLAWLLELPQRRALQSEIRDLLDCAALRRRFDLSSEDLPQIHTWLEQGGWRWGLSAAHRADLGFAACGDTTSGAFALHSLLLGYTNGSDSHFDDLEACGEVGSLDAVLLGRLYELWRRLESWRNLLSQATTPAAWVERARQLLADFFVAADAEDREALEQLEGALEDWLLQTERAAWDADLPLEIFREAWLEGLEAAGDGAFFLGGGVTFCTLMPMRSIPFRMVCLLGMNDEDYPRPNPRRDFDLMALPGMARAGDRSRRDDDRYLMLEALLSARDCLYLSWVGRDPRHQERRTPSALILQLQREIVATWGDAALRARLHEDPLQPFSPRYGEPAGPLTFAREWFPLTLTPSHDLAAPAPPVPPLELGLLDLKNTLADALASFYSLRLGVEMPWRDAVAADTEAFGLDGLGQWQLLQQLWERAASPEELQDLLAAERRRGRLPLAAAGRQQERRVLSLMEELLRSWQAVAAEMGPEATVLHAELLGEGYRLRAELPRERPWNSRALGFHLRRHTSKLRYRGKARADRLLAWWLELTMLQAHRSEGAVLGLFLGQDGWLCAPPPETPGDTLAQLQTWLGEALREPQPLSLDWAMALLEDAKRGGDAASQAYLLGDGQEPGGAWQQHWLLRRHFTDPEAVLAWRNGAGLSALDLARRIYAPYCQWLARVQPLPDGLELPGPQLLQRALDLVEGGA
ncbi:exodeoxyribonuclease V subunit gamma [Acidithiobacillus sp.]|uniref:exodeoxyribonuclease V subunit gamma n=1 Tax=Acidithiobacillus sp. TaxID=1872118 RepID=UPI0025BF1BE4|nr:exodeoxyribonuclease V subunit gamma [Acidithiobacillus sp.]